MVADMAATAANLPVFGAKTPLKRHKTAIFHGIMNKHIEKARKI
jgi:hypothetical protein